MNIDDHIGQPLPGPATDPGGRSGKEEASKERQRFRWLDLLRGRGPDEDQGLAEGEQRRLRSHVAHAANILSPKGPLHAFVAQNPLQGLEHLPFDRAIREAERLLGGRGHLPIEAFRQIYASGRITKGGLVRALESWAPDLASRPSVEVRGRHVEAREIYLAQLLHRIDPLPHGTLRWHVTAAKATRRFRDDLPPETRSALLLRARQDLQITLERIGEEWTISEWMHAHTNLDLARRIREQVRTDLSIAFSACGHVTRGHQADRPSFWEAWRATHATMTERIARAPKEHIDRCLNHLGIPHLRREGYLHCIEWQYAAFGETDRATVTCEEFAALWLHYESQFLRELAPRYLGSRGTVPAIQQQYQQDLEAYAVSALWAAVLAKLGLGDPVSLEDREVRVEEILLRRIFRVARDGSIDLHPGGKQQRDLHPETKWPSGQRSHDDFHQRHPRSDIVRSAHEAMERDFGEIGQEGTLGDFCQRITGARITGLINDQMIRWCAAFLDEGLAGWPMPSRERGFYEAWRKLAERDLSFRFMGIKNSRQRIRQLSSDPADSVIWILRTMGIPEEHWTGYLTFHLAALPGWASMIKWRQAHPDYEFQQQYPIDLIQYLAVRLFYEMELVSMLCRKEWEIDGTVAALRAYFLAHPGEHFARSEIAAGDLPDALAGGVVRTGQETIALDWDALSHPAYGDLREVRGLTRSEQWYRFAEMLYVCRHGGGEDQENLEAVCHDAWRLFQLAQLLGLSAEDVRALSAEEPRAMLALLDDLPPATQGLIWLQAYETRYRDQLLALLQRRVAPARGEKRPRTQIVFCLDAREEGIRRHVEARSQEYETFGTAGFFSLPMIFRSLSDGLGTPSCPIVIKPWHTVVEVVRHGQTIRDHQRERRAKWREVLHDLSHRLETNFATAYYLIDLLGVPFGITVAGRTLIPHKWRGLLSAVHDKLIPKVATALQVERSVGEVGEGPALIHAPPQEEAPEPHRAAPHAQIGAPSFSQLEQADIVEGQLRMIGLTRDFARLVVFCGHGSTTENNPYAAAYHCGACGGNRGGPNARAISTMANNPEVRALLRRRGILIPDDTYVLGAEHDTAADRFTYFDIEDIPPTHREDFRVLAHDLYHAAALHATERCRHLPGAPEHPTPEQALRHVQARTVDWAQVYPEWGHATCALMVIGRRELTRGVFLDRRAYLQSYDPAQDPDGAILEEIMAAFIPVVRGISLDYYFSCVDSAVRGVLGAGTKALHNVVGLIGVMQGAGGDLKTGLPAQGVVPLHEPMRVQVIVESHAANVSSIVERHKVLENIFKNQWAHLIAWDPDTGQFMRYLTDGVWENLQQGTV